VEVEDGLSDYYENKGSIFSVACNGLRLPVFYQELIANPHLFLQPFKLARLILYSGRVALLKKWFTGWIESHQAIVEEIVSYTYWFDEITMGLGLVKQNYPQLILISRAHGYDIYEEEYFPYYWPMRQKSLAMLDKLFPASFDGRDYFRKRYPKNQDLFETAHLGISDPGFLSRPSGDGVLRIISCGYILPLKRIDLICEGIAFAAKMRPEQKFEWIHFGNGKDIRKLRRLVKNRFPGNVAGYLPGYVPNWAIMQHYEKNPVDVFVNLSTTEGGAPVSIQEAVSCGIPIIATEVGGNPEIVSERNGILLSANPTPREIAHALLKMCDDPEMADRMRKESRRVWGESFDAEINFQAFARRLVEIRKS
jgi:colanic acid/amylovoran biosynthesis glycosyltransferase